MKIQWWFEPWITSRYCALSSKRINLFRRCQIVHHVELSFCFPKQAAISEKILTPGVENLSLQWRILAQISVDAFTSIAESSVRAFVLAGRFLIYIYLFSHGFFALPFNYEERTLIPGFYVSSISSRPLNSRFTTHGLNRKYLQQLYQPLKIQTISLHYFVISDQTDHEVFTQTQGNAKMASAKTPLDKMQLGVIYRQMGWTKIVENLQYFQCAAAPFGG